MAESITLWVLILVFQIFSSVKSLLSLLPLLKKWQLLPAAFLEEPPSLVNRHLKLFIYIHAVLFFFFNLFLLVAYVVILFGLEGSVNDWEARAVNAVALLDIFYNVCDCLAILILLIL